MSPSLLLNGKGPGPFMAPRAGQLQMRVQGGRSVCVKVTWLRDLQGPVAWSLRLPSLEPRRVRRLVKVGGVFGHIRHSET